MEFRCRVRLRCKSGSMFSAIQQLGEDSFGHREYGFTGLPQGDFPHTPVAPGVPRPLQVSREAHVRGGCVTIGVEWAVLKMC